MGSGSADQLFHAFVDGAYQHLHIPLLGKQVSETNIISGMVCLLYSRWFLIEPH